MTILYQLKKMNSSLSFDYNIKVVYLSHWILFSTATIILLFSSANNTNTRRAKVL